MKPAPTIPLTHEKFSELEAKKKFLDTEIISTITRLQEAREQGDLSENGAYKYAKMELGNLRRQLGEVKRLLASSFVAKKSSTQVGVGFGSTVTITNTTETMTYTLVSQHESDLRAGKLSLQSPLGTALTGKKAGEQVTVTAPNGQQVWQILAVV